MRRIPPEDAFAEALSLTGQQRSTALTAAAVRWAMSDPDAAMTRIVNLQNRAERQSIMRNVLTNMGRNNPDKALELVNLYAPRDDNLERQVMVVFARSKGVDALPAVERYTDRTGNTAALGALLGAWVRQDPQGAIAYAATLPADRQTSVYQAMAAYYARSYPEQAFDWALNLGPELQQVRRSAIASISHRNVELAERNINRVQDPELRDIMIQRVAQEKSQHDVQGALDWVFRNTLSTSKSRQRAITSIARQVANTNPARAARLLNDLPAGGIKENAKRSIAFTWSAREPDRIEEIISSLNLDATTAQRLRNRPRPTGAVRSSPGLGIVNGR